MLACANDETFMTTAIAVMILLLVPMCIPILKKFPNINLSKITSMGAGMAMASVFAFFLPDLISKVSFVASHTEIGFLKDVGHLNFFLFVTFLAAFCFMYTLEKISIDHTKNNHEPSTFLFLVHMMVVCSMLILLVSSFPAMAKTSFYTIGVVCALAAFEIFLEETTLTKHFGAIYSHEGRLVITTAIIVGWIAGIKLFGNETTVFTLLVHAFVMGVILTAIVKCEFDLINQENNYIIFLVSVFVKVCIIYGLVLLDDAKKIEEAAKLNPTKAYVSDAVNKSNASVGENTSTVANNNSMAAAMPPQPMMLPTAPIVQPATVNQ